MKHLTRLTASAVVVAATVALSMSGCANNGSNEGSASSSPVAGGDITIARNADVLSLDPTAISDNPSIWASEQIFDTLVKPSADGKSIEPDLATSWQPNSSGTGFDFTLRSGVKFSNGQELTADDVVWSLQRAFTSQSPMIFLYYKNTIITKKSDSVVSIATDKPYGPLLGLLGLFSNSIIPKNFGGKTATDFANDPIGTGPFRFSEWKHGQYLKLVKNPNYWVSGKPHLNSVTFTVVPDDNTRQTQLQGNQIQINEFPTFSSIATLQKTSGITVGLFPSSRTDYMTMNNLRVPFADRAVRRAITYALDLNSIVKTVTFGHAKPANTYITDAVWGHDDSAKPLGYSPGKAKQELSTSSVPNGFACTLLINSGDSTQSTIAQIVQQSLAQINIKVSIQALDPSAVNDALDKSNFDMAFASFTTDMSDPAQFGRRADARPDVSSATYSHWTNPGIGPILDSAKYSTDQATRISDYSKAQELVIQEAPFVTLFYSPVAYAMSNSVHGFSTTTVGEYTLANTWISQ